MTSALLKQLMSHTNLSERDQEIRLRFEQGATQQKLGLEFGVSRTRIAQILWRSQGCVMCQYSGPPATADHPRFLDLPPQTSFWRLLKHGFTHHLFGQIQSAPIWDSSQGEMTVRDMLRIPRDRWERFYPGRMDDLERTLGEQGLRIEMSDDDIAAWQVRDRNSHVESEQPSPLISRDGREV